MKRPLLSDPPEDLAALNESVAALGAAAVERTIDAMEQRRDGVQWKPWWVRYAEFEGRAIWITDDTLGPGHRARAARYEVLCDFGDPRCPNKWGCPVPDAPHGWPLRSTDSLDEALAAFHEAEEKLLRGEL